MNAWLRRWLCAMNDNGVPLLICHTKRHTQILPISLHWLYYCREFHGTQYATCWAKSSTAVELRTISIITSSKCSPRNGSRRSSSLRTSISILVTPSLDARLRWVTWNASPAFLLMILQKCLDSIRTRISRTVSLQQSLFRLPDEVASHIGFVRCNFNFLSFFPSGIRSIRRKPF